MTRVARFRLRLTDFLEGLIGLFFLVIVVHFLDDFIRQAKPFGTPEWALSLVSLLLIFGLATLVYVIIRLLTPRSGESVLVQLGKEAAKGGSPELGYRFEVGLRFWPGLVLGIVLGMLIVVAVFAVWFSLIVQALVAVGTFSVGLAAFYLTYSTRKERRIRDMTAKVYTPLRKEVLTWLEVEFQRFTVWSELQLSEPWWVRRIPKSLFAVLEQAETVYSKIATRIFVFRELVSQETGRLSEKLAKKGQSHTIRILSEGANPIHIYEQNVWLSGKGLKEYAGERVAKEYPGAQWKLELLIDGQIVGDEKAAEEFANQLIEFLESQKVAREFRDFVSQLKSLGPKVLLRIDKEIG